MKGIQTHLMTKRHALLIEDDSLLRESLSEVLEWELDIEAELITDGQSAIERLIGPVVDYIFLDLHLPYISGLEILDQIRSDPKWADTIVIVMTADIIGATTTKTKADIVLEKPIDIMEIRRLSSKLNRT